MNTNTPFLSNEAKIKFIIPWKVAGAFVNLALV